MNYWWWHIVYWYIKNYLTFIIAEKYNFENVIIKHVIFYNMNVLINSQKTNTYFSRWYCSVHSSKSFISKDFKNREICCCYRLLLLLYRSRPSKLWFLVICTTSGISWVSFVHINCVRITNLIRINKCRIFETEVSTAITAKAQNDINIININFQWCLYIYF